MMYEKYIRVLYVDLNKRKIRIEQREDLCQYLGGVGVASRLLEENIKPELPILHEEQPIILHRSRFLRLPGSDQNSGNVLFTTDRRAG
jgi:aldehyde:ferredoxin oxidoreductase